MVFSGTHNRLHPIRVISISSKRRVLVDLTVYDRTHLMCAFIKAPLLDLVLEVVSLFRSPRRSRGSRGWLCRRCCSALDYGVGKRCRRHYGRQFRPRALPPSVGMGVFFCAWPDCEQTLMLEPWATLRQASAFTRSHPGPKHKHWPASSNNSQLWFNDYPVCWSKLTSIGQSVPKLFESWPNVVANLGKRLANIGLCGSKLGRI